MSPMELFQLAIAEIGDVSAAELSAHLEKKHGVTVAPPFIPLYKASLKELEKNTRLRQKERPALAGQPFCDNLTIACQHTNVEVKESA